MNHLHFKNLNYIKWGTLFTFIIFIISCKQSSKFQFSGTVIGQGVDSIVLAKPISKDSVIGPPYKALDTIVVVNGKFKGSSEISGSELRYFMAIRNTNKVFIAFVDGSEKADIVLYADSLSKSKIVGSPTNDEFQKLTETINNIRKNMQEQYMKLQEDKTFSDADRSTFEKIRTGLEEKYDSVLSKFITRHKNDNLAAFGIVVKGKHDFEELTKSYDGLNELAKNSFFGNEIKGIIDRLKPFSVGSKIKDLSLPDANDSLFSLYSLKGKYVLLHFWMESNPESRQLNEKLKSWYKSYKSKGLEIVNLSIDRDKSKWKKAIQEDQLSWIQLRDSIGVSLSDYGVVVLPHQMLVDPEGIISKVVQGKDLENKMENKLKEVFSK